MEDEEKMRMQIRQMQKRGNEITDEVMLTWNKDYLSLSMRDVTTHINTMPLIFLFLIKPKQ